MKKLASNVWLTLFGLSVVVPLLWVAMSSLKKGADILASPWSLPTQPQWANYAHAWSEAEFSRYFVNSLIASVATLVILLPLGSMAAYVLVRYPFRGSKVVQALFLGGMMFPNFLAIVPLYLLMSQLQLTDSMVGLVLVYVAYSLSFTIFVMGGFFEALPGELAEAAMMDGCGHNATFWKVMLPLARPGLVVTGIFNGIGLWNEYNLAKVLVQKDEVMTLPLGLARLTATQFYQSDWGALFAGLVIVMLPVLIIYWFFKDKVQDAMLAGAIK